MCLEICCVPLGLQVRGNFIVIARNGWNFTLILLFKYSDITLAISDSSSLQTVTTENKAETK